MINKIIKPYPKAEREIIKRFYKVALEYHKKEKRKSQEPFINHPLKVALSLAELNVGYVTICSALLHDVIENYKYFNLKNSDTHLESLFKFTKNIINVYNDIKILNNFKYRDKSLIRDIVFIINILGRLTRKDNESYFNYLYNIFYSRDLYNKKFEKLKDKIIFTDLEKLVLFNELVNFSFNKKDKNILIRRSIEIKLADMLDNVRTLPNFIFSDQTALYTSYKALLATNELRTKARKLIKEKKYYKKVFKLSMVLLDAVYKLLNERVTNFERKKIIKESEIKRNYRSLEKYEADGGFEKVTYKGESYFDGTLVRYGKILLGLKSKEFIGFDTSKDLQINIHRDLIAFRRFVEKMMNEKYKLKGMNILNLEKIVTENE